MELLQTEIEDRGWIIQCCTVQKFCVEKIHHPQGIQDTSLVRVDIFGLPDDIDIEGLKEAFRDLHPKDAWFHSQNGVRRGHVEFSQPDAELWQVYAIAKMNGKGRREFKQGLENQDVAEGVENQDVAGQVGHEAQELGNRKNKKVNTKTVVVRAAAPPVGKEKGAKETIIRTEGLLLLDDMATV